MKRNTRTPKQAVALILAACILAIPMLCFITFYSQDVSSQAMGVIALVNLVVAVGLLGLIDRKWIQRLK